ncbi:MAG: hypothetical protein E4H14_05545 [Candidatus Thorarchaeota archaeon]|nr:MAG: hypothetical protein E4H14_05545 [Candidatus Thorarchaeota archaeon]
MMIERKETSLALFRTGVVDEHGRETVLACGYSDDGEFGYFIIKEHKEGDIFVYTDETAFFRKDNEQTFQEALAKLKEIVIPQVSQ